MNQEQEVKATGAMPSLESLVNFIKGLRFKIIKLSTYNSLENQLKLKDTIINQKEIDLKKYISIMSNNSDTIYHLNNQIEELKTQNELLSVAKEYVDKDRALVSRLNRFRNSLSFFFVYKDVY